MSAAAVDVLRRARAKIEDPKAWIRKRMSAWIDDVQCYCADGALVAVTMNTKTLMESGASLFLSVAAKSYGFETASRLNDAAGTTHADVLALYDRAIAMAEADAGVPS